MTLALPLSPFRSRNNFWKTSKVYWSFSCWGWGWGQKWYPSTRLSTLECPSQPNIRSLPLQLLFPSDLIQEWTCLQQWPFSSCDCQGWSQTLCCPFKGKEKGIIVSHALQLTFNLSVPYIFMSISWLCTRAQLKFPPPDFKQGDKIT